MIHRRKEFADIALQNPTGSRMIFGNNVCKQTKTIQRSVYALAYAARIRICYKQPIEEWIQHAVYGVVQYPILDWCLVDVARFGVGDTEVAVPAVAIGSLRKIVVER